MTPETRRKVEELHKLIHGQSRWSRGPTNDQIWDLKEKLERAGFLGKGHDHG